MTDPFALLEQALAQSSTRAAPPPGYWSTLELAAKLKRSESSARRLICRMKAAGMLNCWQGNESTGGRMCRYAFKDKRAWQAVSGAKKA